MASPKSTFLPWRTEWQSKREARGLAAGDGGDGGGLNCARLNSAVVRGQLRLRAAGDSSGHGDQLFRVLRSLLLRVQHIQLLVRDGEERIAARIASRGSRSRGRGADVSHIAFPGLRFVVCRQKT